ncbi:MAG: glycosyltransferase family 39 protein [Acidobacteria bacterium]|nr:glycosyltransferase family 39 protein [Acidobacteriota bacterium]
MPTPTSRASSVGLLAGVYAAVVGGADWLHAHRLVAAAIGAPLVLAALVAVHHGVLLGFPNSGDEYVYLYQARMFAGGEVSHAAAGDSGLFHFNYIAREAGRVFGTFPLGWPLALALALAAGVPAGLVNPALGVLTLALVWALGARLYTPRIGVLAAAIVGVSPFFVFTAASYFSHTFCGVLLLAAAWLAARHDRGPAWVPLTIGALVGWAVLARYLTGVVVAVPIVWWLLRPGVPRARTLLLVGLGGLPWIAVLMAYNLTLSGSPWHLTTTPLTVSRWFAAGSLLRGADILASHLVRHLLWTPPVLLVAYGLYLRVAAPAERRGLFAWLPVLMAAALYFYMERGGNQYGARFHYEVFPFAVLFVTAQMFGDDSLAAKPRRDRVALAALALSVALMPVALVVHAAIERRVVRERMDPFTMAAAAGLHDALVLISGRVGSARSMAAFDLTRNDLDLRADVIYGLDPGPGARCAPAARVAGRATYVYIWSLRQARGVLEPVVCP